MLKLFVKICGITQPKQAQQIAALGADAIGLVFAKSPRQITPVMAREIVVSLPDEFPTVGVFVNSSADEINPIVSQTGIKYVQLHGNEPASILADIDAPCIKVFTMRGEDWLTEIREFLDTVDGNDEKKSDNLAAILIDTYNPKLAGGTGECFDWTTVAAARDNGEMDLMPPLLMAGGLKSENVIEAVNLVKPWGVDASSALEIEPGVKDMDKVEAFIGEVRQNCDKC
ncbi:MAG: phosphoribosylanthranilate isomerase [Phycisphaerae bacterium]|nr:phosphoribosylanthranilate isomerase [Phycisphaerae bacterium]